MGKRAAQPGTFVVVEVTDGGAVTAREVDDFGGIEVEADAIAGVQKARRVDDERDETFDVRGVNDIAGEPAGHLFDAGTKGRATEQ